MRLSALRRPIWGVLATVAATAALTAVLIPFRADAGFQNETLLFLLVTLIASAVWGLRVGLFAALLTNLALNFFFVHPYYRFTVHSPTNAFALVVFLVVSAVGGSLLSAAQAAAREARRRQAETEVLLALSRAMIGRTEPRDALAALCQQVVQAFDAPGAAVLTGADNEWTVLASAGSQDAARLPDAAERGLVREAALLGAPVRLGYSSLARGPHPRIVGFGPGALRPDTARAIAYVPLRVGNRTLGVLRLDGPVGGTAFREHPDHLLAAFADEGALALQRVELAQAAAHAEALMEADQMKSALLASISHDLKTPLAGIKTSVTSLLDASVRWSPEDVAAFLETIDSQADRLNRVISDILDLNRIEAGAVKPLLAPLDARALLNDAKRQTAGATAGREVTIDVPMEARLLADESLILQALVNLIENAARYSTAGTPIRLGAAVRGMAVELSVGDEGPGIPPEDVPHVFERFYRVGEPGRRIKGSGLGLAIVKGFVGLCGGSVRVESSPGSTAFTITLPSATKAALRP